MICASTQHVCSISQQDNLLISHDTIKYIDFGLSFQVDDADTPHRHGRCGTSEYMAPEVDENEPYTLTADCWSLGVVLFQMFSGTATSNIASNQFIQTRKITSPTATDHVRNSTKLSPAMIGLLDQVLHGDFTKRASANALVTLVASIAPESSE